MLNTKYKIQDTKYKLKGFTLIELLIYTGISVIIGGLTVGTLLTVTKINQNASATAEVSGQMNFVLQRFQQLVSESSNIDIDAGVTTSTVKLRMQDPTKDPTCIYLSSGVIKLAEGPGSPNPNNCNSTTSDLTNSRVIVNTLNFKKLVQYPGHDTLSLDMTMAYNTANPGSQVSRSLSSAIGRVSAATFDSNLLPGSTSFTVGQSGSTWQNVFVGDGSAANPSYSFGNSVNVGLFKVSGTSTLGFATAGSERMRIDASGNVGIGTTGPANKLSITGYTTALTAGGQALEVYSDTNHRTYLTQNSVGGSQSAFLSQGARWLNTTGTYTGQKTWAAFGSPAILLDNENFGGFKFLYKAGGATVDDGAVSTLMTILSSGNVGIGTTNPGFRTVIANQQAKTSTTRQKTLLVGTSEGDAGNAFGLEMTITGGASDAVRLFELQTASFGLSNAGLLALQPYGGNVGIGTTGPGYKLDVVEGTADTFVARFKINSNKTTAGYNYGVSLQNTNNTVGNYVTLNNYDSAGASNAWIEFVNVDHTTPKGAIAFTTRNGGNYVRKMYIDESGNVGIGTTGPGYKVDVSGDVGTTGNLNVLYNAGGCSKANLTWGTFTVNQSNDTIGMYQASENRMAIDARRDCSNNTAELVINPSGGAVLKPGGGSFGDSSDERLKTNIVGISSALEKIAQLKPVLFDWRNPQEHGNIAAPGGFIAQDIKMVFPEFVTQGSCVGADCALVGGENSLEYTLNLPIKFDAYLVAAIQELNTKVDTLASTTVALQNQLGFIAQDVQSVIPEAVVITDEKTGMLGLKSNFIIPYLVNAVKDIWNKIINHETRIQQLEKKNADLEMRIKILEEKIR